MAKPGGLTRGIHCNECSHGKFIGCLRQLTRLTVPKVIRSMEDLKAHQHTSYIEVYTEKHLNQIIARSYRQCQNKAGRADDMVAEGSEQCMMCLQSMSHRDLRTSAPFMTILPETLSSSSLPCRQCNENIRFCPHCGQHASKLHIHDLPGGDSFGIPRLSSTTVIQNITMDSLPMSLISLQPPQQSPTDSRTRSSPVPRPVSGHVSRANHHSPLLSPNSAMPPLWNRANDENKPYHPHGASRYSVEQDQNESFHRSLSDPTVNLSRSRPPSGSPQPYPTGQLHSTPLQNPIQSSHSASAARPISPLPEPSPASHTTPAEPVHPRESPQPAAPTTPDTPITPPIARLSSAPQVLVSSPQYPQEDAIPEQKRSKFTGIKKAYDVTQKNAATHFVTRVAAKTAFGAVTNVIGADISSAIDNVGGLNLGGTGIDAGNLVGRAVTSAADTAFDEAMGENDRGGHGGGRWKNLRTNVIGRQGARLGGGDQSSQYQLGRCANSGPEEHVSSP